MKNLVFILLLSIIPISIFSQEKSCKVLMETIADTYEGDCKNGLAQGKGIATGEDTYAGMFKEGFPEGKGKYTYKNGNIFSGYWSRGLKNGKGKFTFQVNGKANNLEGYWKDDEYTGVTNLDEFYRVTNITGIESYSIKSVKGEEIQIKISFENAMVRVIPMNLEVEVSTGDLQQVNKDFMIYNYTCPANCSIRFLIKSGDSYRQCSFTFDILKEGKYEVLITNS